MSTDTSGAGNGPAVGNYKGVMLCNRPLAGDSGGNINNSKPTQSRPSTFIAGVQKEVVHPRGWDPLMRQRTQNVLRPKPKSVVAKHKQWLRSFARENQEKKRLVAEEMQLRHAKTERFMQTQAKLRHSVKQTLLEEQDESGAISRSEDGRKRTSKQTKPAWAVSAAEMERKEADEANDLLNFAATLDFDAYINDLEVKTALQAVQQRIEQLHHDEQVEDVPPNNQTNEDSDEEGNVESATPVGTPQPPRVQALTEGSLKTWNKHVSNDEQDNVDDHRQPALDSQSLAHSVLSSASTIRSIHSKRSLAKLIEKKKNEKSTLAPISEDIPPKLPPIALPRIEIIKEDGGTRLNKTDPSNLPYLNRNPAV